MAKLHNVAKPHYIFYLLLPQAFFPLGTFGWQSKLLLGLHSSKKEQCPSLSTSCLTKHVSLTESDHRSIIIVLLLFGIP
jgi:hypothetical protein